VLRLAFNPPAAPTGRITFKMELNAMDTVDVTVSGWVPTPDPTVQAQHVTMVVQGPTPAGGTPPAPVTLPVQNIPDNTTTSAKFTGIALGSQLSVSVTADNLIVQSTPLSGTATVPATVTAPAAPTGAITFAYSNLQTPPATTETVKA
jgi:hypothetical protein